MPTTGFWNDTDDDDDDDDGRMFPMTENIFSAE
jgi:hypothetical protein